MDGNCCGNCDWWGPGPLCAPCRYPIPFALKETILLVVRHVGADGLFMPNRLSGTGCPCWKPKEATNDPT